MYPLSDGYKQAVKDFLKRLHTHQGIEIITNGVSTQVFGNYDAVMAAYTASLKPSIESELPIAVVSKIINSHLPPNRWDTSQWS